MPDAIEAEFEMMTRRAGLTIPPERRAALLQSFRDFREQIAILHAVKSPALELSNVFSLPRPGAPA
jgi:hypothetical protein